MKTINPCKSDAVLRYLYHSSTFDSAMNLRMKLIEAFKDLSLKIWCSMLRVSSTAKFGWELMTILYKGEITLWCDGRAEEEEEVSKKVRKKDAASSRRQEKEAEVD